MARILPFARRKVDQAARSRARAEANEHFPDLVKRLSARLVWS